MACPEHCRKIHFLGLCVGGQTSESSEEGIATEEISGFIQLDISHVYPDLNTCCSLMLSLEVTRKTGLILFFPACPEMPKNKGGSDTGVAFLISRSCFREKKEFWKFWGYPALLFFFLIFFFS